MHNCLGLLWILCFALLGCSSSSENSLPENEGDKITVNASDFSSEIDENPNQGDLIGVVGGLTNKGSVKFEIIEELPAGALSIDSETGELTVADASLFNYEEHPEITADVLVTNGTVSDLAAITIILKDVMEIKVYQGDLTLSTQSEIDTFGNEHYTHISGSLAIFETAGLMEDNIVDLKPLSSLVSIEFFLDIVGTDKLKSLSGLENLSEVGGLGIKYNRELVDITSLNGITELEESLSIERNSLLPSLHGLHNITRTEILKIIENPALNDLSGLEKIELINQTLTIAFNENLISLHGLEQLRSLGHTLTLERNPILSSLEALSGLTTLLNTRLGIYGNNSLSDLTGLASSYYSRIEIMDNDMLQNLDGLSNLELVETGIILENNPELANLDVLTNVIVTEFIIARNNTNLIDFCGVRPMLDSGHPFSFIVESNGFNPTLDEIAAGNCSL